MASQAAIPLCQREDGFRDNSDEDDSLGSASRGIPIRSISRAITVLREINRHEALSVAELSELAQVPYPTANRIVQTLVHEGLIERQESSKRYRPTANVTSLASGYDINAALCRIARPCMERATLRVGWPLSLTTHVGQSMIIRASTHDLTSLTLNTYQPGYLVPVLESAAGIIYLAYCDKTMQQAIISQLRRFGDGDMKHKVQLAVEGGLLQTVRANGYATRSYNRFTRNPGRTSSLAVPILKDGSVQGALSLAFFASAINMRTAIGELLPELRSCASNVSNGI